MNESLDTVGTFVGSVRFAGKYPKSINDFLLERAKSLNVNLAIS